MNQRPLIRLALGLLLATGSALGEPEAPAESRPVSVPDEQAYDAASDPYSAQNYVQPQQPGLVVDDEAPDVSVLDHDGTKIDLKDLWSQGPLIVVFIKGGWCSRCVDTMGAWKYQLDRVEAAGATMIAVTPLKPENILPLIDLYKCEFPIFSDRDGRIGRAFKVRVGVTEPEQLAFYRTFDLDLSTLHADGTWDVPAHSTFIIDMDGVVRGAWAERSSMRQVAPLTVVKALEALNLASTRSKPEDAPEAESDTSPHEQPGEPEGR